MGQNQILKSTNQLLQKARAELQTNPTAHQKTRREKLKIEGLSEKEGVGTEGAQSGRRKTQMSAE